MDDLKKNNRASVLYYIKFCASFHSHQWIQTGVTVWKCSNRVKIDVFGPVPCDLKIWRMASKNIRTHLLCWFKLCASFQSHQWFQSWVTVRKHSIRVKIGDFFLSRVTFEFYGWPWKTIGHLFYTTPSLMHHFKAMGKFKLELEYGNAQFGSKSAIFCPMWPWNLITLKNKRTPLVSYFKLCASFRSHWWIQTGVTVRKRPIWVKINNFISPVTLKFDGCLEKQ